ncbi:hypothetical protein SSBG_00370 [Streptomyces sp. SPB074]|nr:hypothetical protein SSBG_00370 [Streptomyces sp. SPB074]
MARTRAGPGVLVRTRAAPRTVPAGMGARGLRGRERAGRFGMYSDPPTMRQGGSGLGRVPLSSRYGEGVRQPRDVRERSRIVMLNFRSEVLTVLASAH